MAKKVLSDEEKIVKLQKRIDDRAQLNFDMCYAEILSVCQRCDVDATEIAKAIVKTHKINYTIQVNENSLAQKLIDVVRKEPKAVVFS